MQKIMFNDTYLLTQAVLEGRKKMMRRICKVQPMFENYEIAFPVGWINEDDPLQDPLYGAYRWINKDYPKEKTDWIVPNYKVGEVVAVAQSYKNIGYQPTDKTSITKGNKIEFIEFQKHKGWTNKMFVKADDMMSFLQIKDIKIEKLQDISDEDCIAEGIREKIRYCFEQRVKQTTGDTLTFLCSFDTPREAFAALIDKVSGKGTWESNPYVFAYSFELVK